MLRFPVKKIRKQFKLLLLLVLLTFAVWFTYLHINQGKSIKLHFNYGKDGERPMEGTDTSRKRDSRSSDKYRKSEDASNSQEEENAMTYIPLSHPILLKSPIYQQDQRHPRESPAPPLNHEQNEDGIEVLKPIYFMALVGVSSLGLPSLKRFQGSARGQGQ
ncbi:N-acetyl-beta-glucosaminyl-glycoprotein 4-beta-N-acetylgalactosaminyltransferase 1-like [Sinocyclocheilus grahami]|uniref:N-acetyl-beta-glucosaminyl-glycoprotein 4-beta-N-acetylgalactosaminyltransferase 1-like n=1 Tax=Sinocyclocheilus grahami TaxID=75366 RepID=UPI0007ACA93C|nr:PREDICTED: N-acetyl-beta-glucosaminyl-glycoprotein 4-beta-N-acetylgalactosaminyltransferase 1-like [Sinocyclocheilus grahami]